MTAPTATPMTPAEFDEWVNTALSTPEKAQEAINSGSFKEKLQGYAKAYAEEKNKEMKDLKAQVEDSVTASVLEMFKNNGVKPDTARPDLRAQRAGTARNNHAAGTLVEEVWNTGDYGAQMLSDLLTPAKRMTSEQRARMDKYDEIRNAYSSQVPSTGGYLVPEEVRSEILTPSLETSVVRPQAQVVPMPTGKFRYPVIDMTTEVGEVYGGIVMQWLDEGEEFTATEATFGSIALESHKLGGLASVPNELIRHISALEAWIRANMPNAISEFEDRAFIKGNGVGKPLGGLASTNPALIVVGDEDGQTSGITWNNVLAMFARLLPDSYANAEWDIAPNCIPEIFSMALPVGTGGSAVMLGEGAGPNRLAQTMLGLPIRWTRKAPAALGTQGDISLADWSKYVIGDTTKMQLDTSEHVAFRSDKTEFRILLEVDGRPGLLAPITPEYGGDTLSAFIQLETRATD